MGGLRPLRFFAMSKKRQCCAPPLLVYLLIHLFPTCCENLRPSSFKVRLPGHVKWPHLRKGLNARQSYTEWQIIMKLSVTDIRIPVSIKCISRNCDIRDPRLGQYFDLSIAYKSMGEKWKAPLLEENHVRSTLKHRFTGKIYTLHWNIATIDPVPRSFQFLKGHQRSFLGNSFWYRPARAMKTP